MALGDVAARLGLPAFPCNSEKRPLDEGGFHTATRDTAELARMFDRRAATMIGVPTGRVSGLVVIDVDVKPGRESGMPWLDANRASLPQTRTHKTRSGGLHLLFRVPEGAEIRNSQSRIAPGIDVRGEGGYIIVPPSPGYALADDTQPADMPSWLVRACLPTEPEYAITPAPPRAATGNTHYGLAALEAECQAIRGASFGVQEHTLNSAALKVGALVAGGQILHAYAMSELCAAGRSMPSEPGKPRWTPREIEEKVRRAMGDGASRPRAPEPRALEPRRPPAAKLVAVNGISPPPARPASTKDSDPSDFTEDGLALAFAAEFKHRLVYDHTDEQWWLWTGFRWERDTRKQALDMAREFVRTIREKDDVKALGKIAFTQSILKAAASDPRMAVSHEVWNTSPMLLGTPDGTFDLETGLPTDSRPENFISRQTLCGPAPVGSSSKIWLAFLDQLTNHDKAVQGFLQRLAGYLLTGDVTEEVLTFFYGPGGNGKGVFLGALTSVLNEYAVSVPIEVFTAGSRLQSEYYRAAMAGARMVVASETESGAVWAESQLKEMTGNEAPLSARNPYGKPFTFRPQFKIVLVGNYAPKLKGRSPSMERRLRVVPCTNMPSDPDPTLKDKLRAEFPGILRWMLDGCAAWHRERLGNCDAVMAATGAYFEQQDAFNRWIEDRTICDKGLTTPPGKLHADYQHWAKSNGEDSLSANEFAELLDRKQGFQRVKTNGTRTIRGVGLKPEGGLYENRYGD